MDVKALAYQNMNENIRECLIQITFGLKRIEDVNRQIEEMCLIDENFQVTYELHELNANLITCIKHLEQYGIILKMLMQLKETKKLEEEEKAVHSYLIENITTCVATKPYYLKQKEELNRQIEEMCHNNENF